MTAWKDRWQQHFYAAKAAGKCDFDASRWADDCITDDAQWAADKMDAPLPVKVSAKCAIAHTCYPGG